MKADAPTQLPAAGTARQDPHRSLHSETGALPGEHPGRSKNPLIKVVGLAWLEFEKPDRDRAERFLTDFGFTVADRYTGDVAAARPVGGHALPGGTPRPYTPLCGSSFPGWLPR
jgi:hypothetical protein